MLTRTTKIWISLFSLSMVVISTAVFFSKQKPALYRGDVSKIINGITYTIAVNPVSFNPTTGGTAFFTFNRSAPRESQFKVFTQAGELIKGPQPLDQDQVSTSWNGKDNADAIVPNGIYIGRLLIGAEGVDINVEVTDGAGAPAAPAAIEDAPAVEGALLFDEAKLESWGRNYNDGLADVEPNTHQISTDQKTIRFYGNSWKAIKLDSTTIARGTILEFDFKSTGQNDPEINAILLDINFDDNGSETITQIYGTQEVARYRRTYGTYTGNNQWQHFSIPIGTFIGNGENRNDLYLVLANDADQVQNTEVFFRNIVIHVPTSDDVRGVDLEIQDEVAEVPLIIAPQTDLYTPIANYRVLGDEETAQIINSIAFTVVGLAEPENKINARLKYFYRTRNQPRASTSQGVLANAEGKITFSELRFEILQDIEDYRIEISLQLTPEISDEQFYLTIESPTDVTFVDTDIGSKLAKDTRDAIAAQNETIKTPLIQVDVAALNRILAERQAVADAQTLAEQLTEAQTNIDTAVARFTTLSTAVKTSIAEIRALLADTPNSEEKNDILDDLSAQETIVLNSEDAVETAQLDEAARAGEDLEHRNGRLSTINLAINNVETAETRVTALRTNAQTLAGGQPGNDDAGGRAGGAGLSIAATTRDRTARLTANEIILGEFTFSAPLGGGRINTIIIKKGGSADPASIRSLVVKEDNSIIARVTQLTRTGTAVFDLGIPITPEEKTLKLFGTFDQTRLQVNDTIEMKIQDKADVDSTFNEAINAAFPISGGRITFEAEPPPIPAFSTERARDVCRSFDLEYKSSQRPKCRIPAEQTLTCGDIDEIINEILDEYNFTKDELDDFFEDVAEDDNDAEITEAEKAHDILRTYFGGTYEEIKTYVAAEKQSRNCTASTPPTPPAPTPPTNNSADQIRQLEEQLRQLTQQILAQQNSGSPNLTTLQERIRQLQAQLETTQQQATRSSADTTQQRQTQQLLEQDPNREPPSSVREFFARQAAQEQDADTGQQVVRTDQIASGASTQATRGATTAPTLQNSPRLYSAPERGDTGPGILIYLGILGATQGLYLLRRKRRK